MQAWAQAQLGESPLLDTELVAIEDAAPEISAAMGGSLMGATSSASGLMAQEALGPLLGAHSHNGLIADRWWKVYCFTIDSASDLEM